MDLSDLQEIRRQKTDELRELGIDPYPTRAERTHATQAALALFEAEEKAEALDSTGHSTETLALVGRIISFRHMGKTVFAHIRDGHGTIQLYIRKDQVGDDVFQQVLSCTMSGISSVPRAICSAPVWVRFRCESARSRC